MKNVTADEIKNLIQIFDDSDWRELALQVEDFRIFLSRDPDSAGAPWQTPPAPAAVPGPVSPPPAPASRAPAKAADAPVAQASADATPVPDNCVVVKAPNLGIFYRSPKPGSPPYVELGAEVNEETEICLIEVMKLFTAVKAGVSGIVRRVLVEDAALVEFDQPLILIEPKG